MGILSTLRLYIDAARARTKLCEYMEVNPRHSDVDLALIYISRQLKQFDPQLETLYDNWRKLYITARSKSK